MVDFVKKNRLAILIFTILTALFFASRLYNILSLPIFTDEAIYTRWSQIAKNDANWRFISLTDGKQPMFVWLDIVSMRIIQEPLLAGRLVSVFGGFFTMIGLFFLGREVFYNRLAGFTSAIAYLIYPFALVYDRMALYDTLVGTFAVWALYFSIVLVRRLRLDTALILGMVTGAGVLTKTSGFFNIYLLPFFLFIFKWNEKRKMTRFLRWVGLSSIAVVLTYGYYSIVKLSPFANIIDEKNAIFVYPFRDWLIHPFTFLYGNLVGQWDWFTKYITPSGIVLIVLSFLISLKFFREKIFLVLWFAIPFIALALFGRVLYPRFILFMTLSLLPLIGFSIYQLIDIVKNKWLLTLLFLLLLIIPIRVDYFILQKFSQAPIPDSDLNQYSNDWPSGDGIRESINFFEEQARKGKIYIATQGTFGLLPYSLEIYLNKNKNITIQGFWPIEENVPDEVIKASKKMPTYFVFYQPCVKCMGIGLAPETWKSIGLIYQKEKAKGLRFFSIYKITP
ncbi:MAG: glycosyltransferase family 39 protein [Candidatus Levybacteria bacterium]|nr:glycosyltransferase family 39 protein [Candidatus Levybacteria bacterium]